VTTVVEELGVVLVMTTDGEVTKVVILVRLENVGVIGRRWGLTGDNGSTVDGRNGNETGKSKSNQLEHGDDFEGQKRMWCLGSGTLKGV
jgi:hypothetical protein